jgi:metal-responsive CopG/Arc/MetJ family transcriptional regulator
MKKPVRYRKKTLVAFTDKMEADMLFFCRNKGIKSKSELIRKAVAKYIYSGCKDEPLNHNVYKQIQELLARCQLSISFK